MRRDYRDPTYKKFRQKVLARDKHKCQWYGCNSRKNSSLVNKQQTCDILNQNHHRFQRMSTNDTILTKELLDHFVTTLLLRSRQMRMNFGHLTIHTSRLSRH